VLKLTLKSESSAPPDRVLAVARDFSPRREKVWTNGKNKYFTMHDSGETFADVTEGAFLVGRFWERSGYDWSQPGSVKATVTDSNVFTPGSTWELRATARDGGSAVEMVLNRGFRRGPKGMIAAGLNHTAGRWGAWRSYLRHVLADVENPPT